MQALRWVVHICYYKVPSLMECIMTSYIITTLVLTHITIAAVTIYLHRCMSHRALDLHASVSHFFRFWLWLTTGMRTIEWVAIHRKHHAFNETEDDPHSPKHHGLQKVLWLGTWLYRKESLNQETMDKYGHGCPDDWMERRLYKPFRNHGVLLMLAIDLLCFGWHGLWMWAVQMVWIPFLAAGVVNGIGHTWGYRNFEVNDQSGNFSPWGILIGGEELHNNHHAYPTSAKLSYRWFEFDLGYMYIKLLSLCGLATIKRVMPSRAQENAVLQDARVLLQNRLIILKQYSKSVMIPIMKSQQSLIKQKVKVISYGRLKKLLIAPSTKLDDFERQVVSWVGDLQSNIACAYNFYKRLYAIFYENSQESKMAQAKQWCQEAQKSGVAQLMAFASQLGGQLGVEV